MHLPKTIIKYLPGSYYTRQIIKYDAETNPIKPFTLQASSLTLMTWENDKKLTPSHKWLASVYGEN